MKTSILVLALLSPALLLLTGCKTDPGGPYAPLDTAHGLEHSENFVLLDRGAQTSVTCTGLQETKLSDGRMQVAANVKNRENRRLQVQINCVKFISANDKALRYTIRVREAR
jgi:hypothetical protein